MTPHWFSLSKSLTPTLQSSDLAGSASPSFLSPQSVDGAHDLPAIPYRQMWEESRVWLPQLLQHMVSPLPSTLSESASPAAPLGKYFIHRVQFVGGKEGDDAEADGGQYSVWHMMGPRHLDWVEELPFSEWEGKRSFGKYP